MMLNEPRSTATLQAGGLIRSSANWNNDYAPNSVRRNNGHSRLIMVSLFLHVRKRPSQSLSVLVFQAGHASSILVTRSTAKSLVALLFCGAWPKDGPSTRSLGPLWAPSP